MLIALADMLAARQMAVKRWTMAFFTREAGNRK